MCFFVYLSTKIKQSTDVLLHSSCAEQLLLYMKAEECLSSALHTAKESISQGDLLPSSPVKQGENFFSCTVKLSLWTFHASAAVSPAASIGYFYSEVQQELVFDTINIWQMLSYEDIPEPML